MCLVPSNCIQTNDVLYDCSRAYNRETIRCLKYPGLKPSDNFNNELFSTYSLYLFSYMSDDCDNMIIVVSDKLE